MKLLREMKKGDQLVIYHTGDEKTAVGLAKVKSVDASDAKVPLVRITAGAAIKRPKTLAEIKQNGMFQTSALVRQSRLSVVPLEEAQYRLAGARVKRVRSLKGTGFSPSVDFQTQAAKAANFGFGYGRG